MKAVTFMYPYPLPADADAYIAAHMDELRALLKTLTLIPSPSNQEYERALFCKQWLENNGCSGAYLDEANNVVYPYQCSAERPLVAFLAHTDTVFPDQKITWNQEGDLVHAMGVGDDTAGVAVLLMIARYVTQQNLTGPYGLLFVANAGEEGLGNLKGSRQIVKDFGDRMVNFITFDGGMTHCLVGSVGSQRYAVTVRTEGGHSYGDFGNRNAIRYAASIIDTLYAMKAPDAAKTTYNVGEISGGISVNTIANECRFLYEFRSAERACLETMETMFLQVLDAYRSMGIQIDVEVLAIRPCRGDVDEAEQQKLLDRCMAIIRQYHQGDDIQMDVSSTDANIPLAEGIPATSVGVIRCGNAHRPEEWADLASLDEGMHVAMTVVLSYTDAIG